MNPASDCSSKIAGQLPWMLTSCCIFLFFLGKSLHVSIKSRLGAIRQQFLVVVTCPFWESFAYSVHELEQVSSTILNSLFPYSTAITQPLWCSAPRHPKCHCSWNTVKCFCSCCCPLKIPAALMTAVKIS